MALGFAFWILMLVWLVLGAFASWPAPGVTGWGGWRAGMPNLLLFILLGLLGWHAFGPPLHG